MSWNLDFTKIISLGFLFVFAYVLIGNFANVRENVPPVISVVTNSPNYKVSLVVVQWGNLSCWLHWRETAWQNQHGLNAGRLTSCHPSFQSETKQLNKPLCSLQSKGLEFWKQTSLSKFSKIKKLKHRRSSAMDGKRKLDVFLPTRSDASTFITASHHIPKQEFFSLWWEAKTSQQREHSISGWRP